VRFSVVLTKNSAVTRAIGAIPEDAWTPVTYPGAVLDPDTGQLISDAEVAETEFTAFGSTEHPATARLIVCRVRDQNKLDELFPVWRHHPFFTNSTESTVQADLTHRRHAIIETVFADLIDGPLAHLPSNRFAANGAWAICAMITHNLLRATGTLSSDRLAVARGATLRRQIINVPARLAALNAAPCCTCPRTGLGRGGGWRSGPESSTTHRRRRSRPDPSTAKAAPIVLSVMKGASPWHREIDVLTSEYGRRGRPPQAVIGFSKPAPFAMLPSARASWSRREPEGPRRTYQAAVSSRRVRLGRRASATSGVGRERQYGRPPS
jgi:hypothetical protein